MLNSQYLILESAYFKFSLKIIPHVLPEPIFQWRKKCFTSFNAYKNSIKKRVFIVHNDWKIKTSCYEKIRRMSGKYCDNASKTVKKRMQNFKQVIFIQNCFPLLIQWLARFSSLLIAREKSSIENAFDLAVTDVWISSIDA